jgi:hypothetical protein
MDPLFKSNGFMGPIKPIADKVKYNAPSKEH